MLKKILNSLKKSGIMQGIAKNIVRFAAPAVGKLISLMPPPSSKNFVHATNLLILVVSYTITSLLIYPHFQFGIFLKETFALCCAYGAIFLWFVGEINKQIPLRIIVGVTACIAPVFFMNNTFSVALVCLIVLILFEFILFEYARGCDLFSSEMSVYVLCETADDVLHIQALLSENKVLKLILLSGDGDPMQFSSIHSLSALDSWLSKTRRLPFFPQPNRLIYFSQAPSLQHVDQLIELSVKFSISAFGVRNNTITTEGKFSKVLGLVPLCNFIQQNIDKNPLGALFKSKRVWAVFDGSEYIFDIVRTLSASQSIDLTVFCSSEYTAIILKQRLISIFPDKIFKIKVMDFECLEMQENAPDVLFYSMPINSVYVEEDNQKEAVVDNVLKTQKLIQFAQKNNTADVFLFSSTKAFNANTWIGATQRLGELFAQFASYHRRKLGTKFHIIRLPEDSFSRTGIFGEIKSSIRNNGYLCIKDTGISGFQNEKEIFPILLRAISLSMKNESFESAVFTISTKKQTSLDEMIMRACMLLHLRLNTDVRFFYNSEPRPMDLESFPNISEKLESTNVPNVFITRFINPGNDHFKDAWTVEQINRMSTRELVSTVMQSLNEKMKNSRKV